MTVIANLGDCGTVDVGAVKICGAQALACAWAQRTTTNHGLAGILQPIVWSYYLVALPAILLGIFFGLKLDRRINPDVFRRLVQVLLIVMGLRLILL